MLNQVRIRYRDFKDNKLITDPILCHNKLIVVTLDVNTFKFYMVDKETSGVIYESCANSLHKSKKCIKLYLRSIGANFYDEVRLGGKQTGRDGLPSRE